MVRRNRIDTGTYKSEDLQMEKSAGVLHTLPVFSMPECVQKRWHIMLSLFLFADVTNHFVCVSLLYCRRIIRCRTVHPARFPVQTVQINTNEGGSKQCRQ